MKTLWFVVDLSELQLSWSPNSETGEKFPTFDKAQKRARALSQSEPGKTFLICQATHVCCAAVGPSVTMKVGT
jgi:hypothetical protein